MINSRNAPVALAAYPPVSCSPRGPNTGGQAASATRLTLLTAMALTWSASDARAASAAQPPLTVVADLIKQFDEKLVANSMSAKPRGMISSGRSMLRALYEHPRNAEDATITYEIKLPGKPANGQVAFVTWTCVLDEVLKQDKDGRCNGTRFVVRIDGKQVFARDQKPGNWLPVVIPLDDHAGKTVKLQLATNAINGNTNYDWAYWGEPRVMSLPDGSVVGAEPMSGLAGLLMAPASSAGPKGFRLKLQPVNASGGPAGETDDVWLEPAPGCAMTAAQFDLSKALKPGASKVRIAAAAGERPQGLRLLAYEPEIKLSHPSAGRAIVIAGQDVPVCVTLRNAGSGPWVSADEKICLGVVAADPGRRFPRPDLDVEDDPNFAVIDKLDCVVPAGEERVFSRRFKAPKVDVGMALSRFISSAEMRPGGRRRRRVLVEPLYIDKAEPALTERVEAKSAVKVGDQHAILQNPACRVVFVGHAPRRKRAGSRWTVHLQLPAEGKWRTAAVCPVLLEAYVGQPKRDEKCKTPNARGVDDSLPAFDLHRCELVSAEPAASGSGDRLGITFDARVKSHDERDLRVKLTYSMNQTEPIVDVKGELAAPKGAPLLRFSPISLRVADGLPTKDRGMALFPGLEYLDDGEQSSSTRDAHPPVNNRLMPDPLKVTVPMMMVSTQVGMVTLMWNPNQKWNGTDYGPCAAFASPNLVHRQENHLMEVFVPTFPDYVKENERLAAKPYEMKPGEKVTVSARVVLRPKGDAVTAMQDYFTLNPPPKPAPKQHDLQTLYAISRHGLMETVWYPDKQKSSHCVGWAPTNAPQFGVLLWLDSILAKDAAARTASLERTRLIWRNTIRDAGPAGLTSSACCHIMREEAPFYTGHIAAMVKQMTDSAAGQIRGRNADGVWGFQPPNDARHQSLGPRGYASQGIVARGAIGLFRKARVTGNADALAAGLKALEYHERFHVPHGAQGWECPIYEPDILGAAYAVGAYLDAYEMTGRKAYLDKAIYWAWTGMAFQYTWQAPDREQWMRYASIPVFGTTFFTHSWLGNPVQWCGLVYAYYLQKLAPHDKAFPWKRVAEGMTVSGEWLQFGDERPDLKGSYPDGLYKRLTDRCPAMINPEDIILNRYAVEGHDPRVGTRYVRRDGEPTIHVTSCAKLGPPELAGKRLTVPLTFYKDRYSGTLVANCPPPSQVTLGGQTLQPVASIPDTPQGWKYLTATKHLIVRAKHASDEAAALQIQLK